MYKNVVKKIRYLFYLSLYIIKTKKRKKYKKIYIYSNNERFSIRKISYYTL